MRTFSLMVVMCLFCANTVWSADQSHSNYRVKGFYSPGKSNVCARFRLEGFPKANTEVSNSSFFHLPQTHPDYSQIFTYLVNSMATGARINVVASDKSVCGNAAEVKSVEQIGSWSDKEGIFQGASPAYEPQRAEVLKFDKLSDRFILKNSLALGSESTLMAWYLNLSPHNGWRTLARGTKNHPVIVRNDGMLGMFNNETGERFVSANFNMNELSPGWHHIAAVLKDGETKIYIDAKHVGTAPSQAMDSLVSLGNYQGRNQRWSEYLDDFRVFNRALPINEIDYFYNSSKSPELPEGFEGFHGSLKGAASYAYDVQHGQILTFMDNNGRFELDTPFEIGKDFAASFWFQNLNRNGSWGTAFRGRAGNHHVIYAKKNRLELGAYDNVGKRGFRGTGFYMEDFVGDNTWHHLAITADGTNEMRFYVDGNFVGTTDVNTGGTDIFAIGNYQKGGQGFAEKINNVLLFNHSLDENEIARLYESSSREGVNYTAFAVDTSTVTGKSLAGLEAPPKTLPLHFGDGPVPIQASSVFKVETPLFEAIPFTFSGLDNQTISNEFVALEDNSAGIDTRIYYVDPSSALSEDIDISAFYPGNTYPIAASIPDLDVRDLVRTTSGGNAVDVFRPNLDYSSNLGTEVGGFRNIHSPNLDTLDGILSRPLAFPVKTTPRNYFVGIEQADGQTVTEEMVIARISEVFFKLFNEFSDDSIMFRRDCYLVFDPPNPGSCGELYVKDIGFMDIRSEGMSYAMMIMLVVDRKEDFDSLWRFAKNAMQGKSPNPKFSKYFSWHINWDEGRNIEDRDGNENYFRAFEGLYDTNPAPDGEEFFVAALYLADSKWGSNGAIDYHAEAESILAAMMTEDTLAAFPGDSSVPIPLFQPGIDQIIFTPDPTDGYVVPFFHTDPSYHLPVLYNIMENATSSPRLAARLRNIANVSRDYLVSASGKSSCGLYPEYSNFDGSALEAGEITFNANHFRSAHDAFRVIKNIATDYRITSGDPRLPQLVRRILQFYSDQRDENGEYGHIHDIGDGINDNGECRVQQSSSAAGLVAMNAVGAMALSPDDPLAIEFVTDFWNAEIPASDYYNGVLVMQAYLHLSGHFHAVVNEASW